MHLMGITKITEKRKSPGQYQHYYFTPHNKHKMRSLIEVDKLHQCWLKMGGSDKLVFAKEDEDNALTRMLRKNERAPK